MSGTRKQGKSPREISLNDHVKSLRAAAARSSPVSPLFFQGDAAHRDEVGLEDSDDDAEGDDELPPDDGARVVGAHVKMSFNSTTSAFELQYDVGSLDTDLATEIFMWPPRYPGGADVATAASAGSVYVDYNGTGSWVRVLPGDGLQVGARVTVTLAKKQSADKRK